ncbi:MAG TPA: NAD(P)H-dependent oxidoreductase subunit E, partial [Bacillota bacterium]|nr:NAD(P)H-dependent oxidoreductase subunit E [Bacillota bacterium]
MLEKREIAVEERETAAEEREMVLVDELLGSEKRSREEIIPLLQKVQEKLGYLPGRALRKIAEAAGVPAV